LQVTLHALGLLVGRHYVAQVDAHHLTLAEAQESRLFVAHDHAAIARAIVAGSHRKAANMMADHVEHIVETLIEDGLSPDAVVQWV